MDTSAFTPIATTAPVTEAAPAAGEQAHAPDPTVEQADGAEDMHPIARPAPKAAPAAAPKKVKIGDEEFDEEVLLKAVKGPLEMTKGAQKRFQELAKVAKEIEAARAELEQDPFALAQKMGKDPIALAQKILQDAIAKAEMTPEQRRIADLEERLNSTEKQTKEQQATQQQEAQMKLYKAEIERLDRELPGAMERAHLPKSPVSLRLVTNILADMHDAKIPDSPENLDIAAELAAEQYMQDFGEHIKALTYEQALAKYPDLVKTIRNGDLASARKAPAGKPSQSAPKPSNGTSRSGSTDPFKQKMNDEWGILGVNFK